MYTSFLDDLDSKIALVLAFLLSFSETACVSRPYQGDQLIIINTFLIHDCPRLIFYKSHKASLITSVTVVHIKPMSIFLQGLLPFQRLVL